MKDALDLAKIDDGEGHLVLTLNRQTFVTIDGDIRLYLSGLSGNDEVRLSFIAPKEVAIIRSDAKIQLKDYCH